MAPRSALWCTALQTRRVVQDALNKNVNRGKNNLALADKLDCYIGETPPPPGAARASPPPAHAHAPPLHVHAPTRAHHALAHARTHARIHAHAHHSHHHTQLPPPPFYVHALPSLPRKHARHPRVLSRVLRCIYPPGFAGPTQQHHTPHAAHHTQACCSGSCGSCWLGVRKWR